MFSRFSPWAGAAATVAAADAVQKGEQAREGDATRGNCIRNQSRKRTQRASLIQNTPENYTQLHDDKLETRMRAPTNFFTWLKQARAEIRMLESTYGLEHGPQRRDALSFLEEANELDPDEFPETYVRALRE